jgi:hypothetical protein
VFSFGYSIFDKANELLDVNRLDRAARRDAQHRPIGVTEDHVAPARLTADQTIGFGDRHQRLDSPIPGIGPHSIERLCGFRHFLNDTASDTTKERPNARLAMFNDLGVQRFVRATTRGAYELPSRADESARLVVTAVVATMRDAKSFREFATPKAYGLCASRVAARSCSFRPPLRYWRVRPSGSESQ